MSFLIPKPSAEEKLLVQRLCNIDDGLSNWEVNFVESISRRVLEQNNPLTPGQRETAEKILEEKA